jgi:hypothetical protein
LHLLKTRIFMDMIEAGKIPLRAGVLRVVDDAIKAGVQLVSRCGVELAPQAQHDHCA